MEPMSLNEESTHNVQLRSTSRSTRMNDNPNPNPNPTHTLGNPNTQNQPLFNDDLFRDDTYNDIETCAVCNAGL